LEECLKHAIYLATLIVSALAAQAQSTPATHAPTISTISATATLVLVPTLVRTASGEPVTGLTAQDFRLTDNGVTQTVSVQDTSDQPIAVVVVMQTGDASPRQFQNYRTLNLLVNAMLRSSTHTVGLITFDSKPEEIWNFPPLVDGLKYAFGNPATGNHGAAILDAINRGLDLLQQQPKTFRRLILLLSQPVDDGSTTGAEQVVRRLGESNTTLYSVAFTYEKASAERRTDALGAAAPAESAERLDRTVEAMHRDTAAELAALTGGEQVRLHMRRKDKQDLEEKLAILATDFFNSYTLSFRPTLDQPGFHALKVGLVPGRAGVEVSARRSYWVSEAANLP
jgi:VWFA-related protein